MDKKSKNVLIVIGVIIASAVALNLIFKFWWTFIVAALCFGIGYLVGKKN